MRSRSGAVVSYELLADLAGWSSILGEHASATLSAGLAVDQGFQAEYWVSQKPHPVLESPSELLDRFARSYQLFAEDPAVYLVLWQDERGGPVERWVRFPKGFMPNGTRTCPEGHRIVQEGDGAGYFYRGVATDFDEDCRLYVEEYDRYVAASDSEREELLLPFFGVQVDDLARCNERCGWLFKRGIFIASPQRAAAWLDDEFAQIPQDFRPPFD